MEDDSWSLGFSASPRSYLPTLKSQIDLCMEFEDIEEDDGLKTEYACPYCSEDFDLFGLCCHIDEEHDLESTYGVCPVCALRIGMHMVDHITTQHEHLFMINHKIKFPKGNSYALRKELHDTHYQSRLARSWSSLSSSSAAHDPLLSFLSCAHPADSSGSIQFASSNEVTLEEKISDEEVVEKDLILPPSPLSDKEHLEKAKRSEFVQGLLLSTIFDGGS